MNSPTHNSLQRQDDVDWLETLLHESAPAPVADDGFSTRVMQRLAAQLTAQQVREQLQRRTRQESRFEWFSLIGAVLGSAIAFWGCSWPSPQEMASAVNALMSLRPVSIGALAPWLASLVSAAALAYVLQKT